MIPLLFGLTSYGQTKQGYIDFDKVIQSIPYYSTAQKHLETKARHLDDSLNVMMTAYLDFIENGVPHNVELDSTNAALIENRMRTMEKNIQGFQQYAQIEITKDQETIEVTLKDIVVKELEQYCLDNHIVCIVDKKAILHCSDCTDFTDDFVDYYLSRKKQK